MLIKKIVSLSQIYKLLIMVFIDILSIIFALFASLYLRHGFFYWPDELLILVICASPLLAITIFYLFDLYSLILRYIGFNALWKIVKAVSLYALFWGLLAFMSQIDGIPRSVILINWLLSIALIFGTRILARRFLTSNKFVDASNVAIYGAGSAGVQLSIALKESEDYNPIVFIDDDTSLHGRTIHGMDIISIKNIKEFQKKMHISEVLLALPSASRSRRNEIINYLQNLSLKVRSLPGMSDIVKGRVKIDDLRDISIKDLLGRDSVTPNKVLLEKNILNKVVMVTGAGGSIGSELCRQIILQKPKLLVMYDHSEYLLYEINKEMSENLNINVKFISMLGSINNSNRLNKVMSLFKVETIYHAAAYKHVPMVEFNNSEGLINNTFGTLCCAEAAIEAGVTTFVLISTDKAVRPTNIMGASKRLSELVIQSLADHQSLTKFTIVRFGNVLGSSGSVIPIFTKQIQEGGPVKVTDAKMMRYFMTIPEAVQLVIQSGAMGRNGDVFVLDMGEPVSIALLARKMIELSGLKVKDKLNKFGDIEIIYTGSRPGEKLYEELLIGDNVSTTSHPMILSAKEEYIKWEDLKHILENLNKAVESFDFDELRKILISSVSGYKPKDKVVDYLYSKKLD